MHIERCPLPAPAVPPSEPLLSHYPRQELQKILRAYQEKIGNTGLEVERSLQALASKPCVVTGQQVGLMGGPSMVFLKALSCLQLAKHLDAVPIFWAATEDHDVEEVAWATLLGPRGDLERYRVSLPHGCFVEDLPLTASHREVIERFVKRVDMSLPPLQERYGEAMVQILSMPFAGKGLLFIEPYLLRPLAAPFFQKAMRFPFPQLPPGPLAANATPLFYKGEGGKRLRVEGEVLLELLSTGASLRPLLQCQLFPTLAYVGGPTELQYHHQLIALFKAFEVPMPQLYRRLSATFIDQKKEENEHRWENLIHPRSQPQERVLSWWNFKGQEGLLELPWEANTELTVMLS